MYANLSKTLEGIFARVAFQAAKHGTTHRLHHHLALALLDEEGSLAYQLLTARLADWELYQLRLRIEQEINASSHPTESDPERFFREFHAQLAARYPDVKRLSTVHALLHLLADGEQPLAHLFARYHITPTVLEEELRRITDEEVDRTEPLRQLIQQSAPTHPTPNLLQRLATDLTSLAEQGALDPVVGREKQIDRLIRILARRKKNNPLLVGDAGVGKTALIEGLAQRIATGDVPETLRRKRIFSLEVATLVAGTKFRGEFEERMQQLVDELRKNRSIILFIDEIHTIVGAGSTQGSLEMGNILKPALARGEVQLIGATTHEEYRREMERDGALERRFQRIDLEQPTPHETLQILRQIAPTYAQHHAVHYTEEALAACIELADRYLTQRSFPDKAIDLMDEAGARAAHLRTPSKESTLTTLRQARQQALEEGRYPDAEAARLEELALTAQAERTADTPTTVDVAMIRSTLTELTGIPVEELSQDEATRLSHLAARLQRRVIGQTEATERLARALLRARTGLQPEHRPIGVFLFVGPTGVGKTLMAKELAAALFDEKRGLIRIDMSEYGEKHNVARLIGAPPGYVGYGEGGQLTEAVRRHPHAVVLLDEIEKAHPEVLNILLQLCDEGQLTDGVGRKVDFRHTILIMTSNVGSRRVSEATRPMGYATAMQQTDEQKGIEQLYRKALERHFAPELLNRVDEVILFRPLGRTELTQIIELELTTLSERMQRLGYTLRISAEVKEHLLTLGYDARYGARALRRLVVEQLETPLAEWLIAQREILSGEILVEHHPQTGIRLRAA